MIQLVVEVEIHTGVTGMKSTTKLSYIA